MAQVCEFTGIRPLVGNKVSHSNIKTKTRQCPNLLKKKYFVPELGRWVTLTLSTRAFRTIDHRGGITKALLKAKDETLSPRLRQLKSRVRAKLKASATPKK